MAFQTISYRVEAGVGHVRFTPPGGVTVVNPTFAREFRDVMVEIEFDDAVKAVSVTAEGKVFCAGGDLKYFNSQGDELPKATAQLIIDLHAGLYKMHRMPKVFVAGIRGAAGGAGLSMASAFDLVVSGRSTKFTMAYTQAGLTPDGTSSYFIARHIGLRRMLELTLMNRVLSAAEAESWGLVNQVVDDDEVDAVATDLAQRMADGPAWALGRAKQVVYNGVDASLEEAGEFEGVGITASMLRPDGPEGIAAFVEKRAPNFTGD
jgi:2-(1,2-epoxy-1,2-dihydrophenyl)acetyl-CoA isomerase